MYRQLAPLQLLLAVAEAMLHIMQPLVTAEQLVLVVT